MKFRNKALIKILTALILIAVTLSIPLATYAANGVNLASMTSSATAGLSYLDGGAYAGRTGWLFYCIDPVANTQVTDTICWTNGWNLNDKYNNFIPNKYMISRYGVEVNWDLIEYTTLWGFGAWTETGSGVEGNGTRLKEYLLDPYTDSDDGRDHTNAYGLVKANFGSDMAAKFNRQEVYLVFEPIFAHHIYKNGKSTGYWAIGTSFWWGQIQIAFGLPDTGDYMLNKFTNNHYARCVMLEDNEVTAATRFSPATDPNTQNKITNQELGLDQWNGYGIGIIRSDTEIQSTCDESKSSPHKPADESTGTYQIVKNYVSQMTAADGTITYTDEGCYTKVDSAAEISIEDESSNTGYTLMQWYATDSSDTSVTSVSNNSLVWDSNVPVVSSPKIGTSSEYTIDLEDDETILGTSGKTAAELGLKTVYLLLVKMGKPNGKREF